MQSLRLSITATLALILLAFAPIHAADMTLVPESRASDLDQKLKSIIVSVDFTNAKLDEAIQALSFMSKQLDPDHRGVNFIIQPEAGAVAKPIALQLNKVPLGVALHYVCELAHVHYKISDYAVSIAPNWGEEGLVKRTFHVDPSFVETASKAGAIPTPSSP
jgi:N-acetylglucosamine-6-phosphate deacetylase